MSNTFSSVGSSVVFVKSSIGLNVVIIRQVWRGKILYFCRPIKCTQVVNVWVGRSGSEFQSKFYSRCCSIFNCVVSHKTYELYSNNFLYSIQQTVTVLMKTHKWRNYMIVTLYIAFYRTEQKCSYYHGTLHPLIPVILLLVRKISLSIKFVAPLNFTKLMYLSWALFHEFIEVETSVKIMLILI